jgi:hypothetical protein
MAYIPCMKAQKIYDEFMVRLHPKNEHDYTIFHNNVQKYIRDAKLFDFLFPERNGFWTRLNSSIQLEMTDTYALLFTILAIARIKRNEPYPNFLKEIDEFLATI